MKRLLLASFFLSIAVFTVISCKEKSKDQAKISKENFDELLEERFELLLEYPLDSMAFPRSININSKKHRTTSSRAWTSGFFAGNLWYVYQLTDNKSYEQKALSWTKLLEREKVNNSDHDIGFKVYNSFGKAYEVSQNQEYVPIIIQSAKTLATRFNKRVKAIKSWDSKPEKWDYPVIIDNMMNLELLFEATKLSKDSTFHKIAVKHANTTLKNHFRPDDSSYHVIAYDSITGNVEKRLTHQGFSDSSSWSRGQAWTIYGFTMAYRYTHDKNYLNQAEATAAFYLSHKKLPQDGIPYWDFDDPAIPNAPKDVSAATITASSFFELYEYTHNKKYIDYAHKVLGSLKSAEYFLDHKIKAPYILNRSTGNYNKKSELDGPMVYADYYYLEALIRSNKTIKE